MNSQSSAAAVRNNTRAATHGRFARRGSALIWVLFALNRNKVQRLSDSGPRISLDEPSVIGESEGRQIWCSLQICWGRLQRCLIQQAVASVAKRKRSREVARKSGGMKQTEERGRRQWGRWGAIRQRYRKGAKSLWKKTYRSAGDTKGGSGEFSIKQGSGERTCSLAVRSQWRWGRAASQRHRSGFDDSHMPRAPVHLFLFLSPSNRKQQNLSII